MAPSKDKVRLLEFEPYNHVLYEVVALDAAEEENYLPQISPDLKAFTFVLCLVVLTFATCLIILSTML